jgi:hypothetical protein
VGVDRRREIPENDGAVTKEVLATDTSSGFRREGLTRDEEFPECQVADHVVHEDQGVVTDGC